LENPYKDILLAKCDEISQLLASTTQKLDLPFSVNSTLNEKNIYHAIISIETAGKKVGAVNVWFSPKKNSFKVTTDKTKDEVLLKLYSTLDVTSPVAIAHTSELTGYHIFTDGSFNGKQASWAYVLLKDGKKVTQAAGVINDPEHRSSYQIIGEFTAVIESLKKCDALNIDAVTLHYDLDLAGKIATGRYNAKAPVSQFYLQSLKKIKVSVTWNKVKAHSGIKWNEYVDKLASRALSPTNNLSLEDLFQQEFETDS
jgi:ribonuclease HI